MFTADLMDDGKINNNFGNYLKNAAIAGATSGLTSFGKSIYNYYTWDRFTIDEKLAEVSKGYSDVKVVYDPNPDATYLGEYRSGEEIYFSQSGLASKNTARITMAHEYTHFLDNKEFPANSMSEMIARDKNFGGSYGFNKYTENRAYQKSLELIRKNSNVSINYWLKTAHNANVYKVSNPYNKIFSLPLIFNSIY